MKIYDECYPCLVRLVNQAAELATDDPRLRTKAIGWGIEFLDNAFSTDKTSIDIATPLHRIVKQATGNKDPYLKMKENEICMARQLVGDSRYSTDGGLRERINMAVLGNSIDFFRTIDEIQKDMELPVEFAIDHIAVFEEELKQADTILYLADNTGEVLFDLGLIGYLSRYGRVTYAVKESPVQNDVSLIDIDYFQLRDGLPRIIDTGTDTPGVDMEIASDRFKSEYENTCLVIAKGMGYWETLSELPAGDKVLHLLKAKCLPVADSLNVPVNSYVALFR